MSEEMEIQDVYTAYARDKRMMSDARPELGRWADRSARLPSDKTLKRYIFAEGGVGTFEP